MRNSLIKKYIIFLILILIAFLGVSLINKNKNSQNLNTSEDRVRVQAKTYETKTDSQGAIDVEVTPKVISSKDNSSFDVAINNHQVDLNYDLAKIAILTDDKGNKYTPVSWSGSEGGHHALGTLVFPKLSREAKSIKLFLPKIGGKDRHFSWEI